MEPLKGATVEPMSIGTLDELDGAASARRRRRCCVAAGACALLFMATLALRVAAARKPEDTQNIDGPANYMQPVQTVGLFNRATGRWLRVTDQGGADSPSMGVWNQGLTWEERFEIRPFNGYAGLYNPATNRWLAVTYQGGANAPLVGQVFDHTAVVCHFVLTYNQDGTVGLQNPATGRWLRVTDQGGADSPSMGPWQSEWQWERFELRQAAIYMQPVQTAGIEGIYDCTTVDTIVVITATMDPNVVQIRGSFVKIDQNTLAYEMRRSSSPMVWHSVPSPQFERLSKMWGGAPLRYEFEPGMGAFVSIAAGKPNTRYVKRSEHD